MNTVIKVVARSVYGTIKYYPANGVAESFCRLLGQTTITGKQLKCITGDLGYTIEYVPDTNLFSTKEG